ncbi:MAG: DUF1707 domain-containing protein [Corynebacterium sp.]|nr:DUF1707 domain-containing protein [Corynebacterium sp.]
MSQIHDYRIGDTERQQAMNILSSHFAAGRLNATEYDTRLTAVANATLRSELTQLFADLPTAEKAPVLLPQYVPVISEEALAAYKQGRNMRIGVVMLTFIGAEFTGAAIPGLGSLMSLLGVTLFVLLFIMRVGPATWFQPDPRKEHRRQVAQACQIQEMQRHMLR